MTVNDAGRDEVRRVNVINAARAAAGHLEVLGVEAQSNDEGMVTMWFGDVVRLIQLADDAVRDLAPPRGPQSLSEWKVRRYGWAPLKDLDSEGES